MTTAENVERAQGTRDKGECDRLSELRFFQNGKVKVADTNTEQNSCFRERSGEDESPSGSMMFDLIFVAPLTSVVEREGALKNGPTHPCLRCGSSSIVEPPPNSDFVWPTCYFSYHSTRLAMLRACGTCSSLYVAVRIHAVRVPGSWGYVLCTFMMADAVSAIRT